MTPNARRRFPFSRSRINVEDPLFITTFTAELLLASERRGPPPEKMEYGCTLSPVLALRQKTSIGRLSSNSSGTTAKLSNH